MLHTQHVTIETNKTHQRTGFRSVLRKWKAGFKSNSTCHTRQIPNTPAQSAQTPHMKSSASSQRSSSQAPSLAIKSEPLLLDSHATIDRLASKSTTQTIIHSPLDKRNRGSVSSSTYILRRPCPGSRRDTILGDCDSPKPNTRLGAAMSEMGSRSGSRMSDRASTCTRNSKSRFSLRAGSVRIRREDGDS